MQHIFIHSHTYAQRFHDSEGTVFEIKNILYYQDIYCPDHILSRFIPVLYLSVKIKTPGLQ